MKPNIIPADSPVNTIPGSEAVRRRLALVATEAAQLRAQLKISQRWEAECERLKRQHLLDDGVGA